WAGPVRNWIAACDRVLALGAATVVPGHGPLATGDAVRDLKGYFEYLTAEARIRFDAGMTPLDPARGIDLGPDEEWGEGERLAGDVQALYRDFGAELPGDALALLGAMAALAHSRRRQT